MTYQVDDEFENGWTFLRLSQESVADQDGLKTYCIKYAQIRVAVQLTDDHQ